MVISQDLSLCMGNLFIAILNFEVQLPISYIINILYNLIKLLLILYIANMYNTSSVFIMATLIILILYKLGLLIGLVYKLMLQYLSRMMWMLL